MHLAELEKPDVLNSLLPGLGRDWGEILGGSLSTVLYRMMVYATEWEAVAARWAADDHALLQPSEPSWCWMFLMVQNLLKQKVAKNELELCGPLPLCLRVLVRDPIAGLGVLTPTCWPRRLGVSSGSGAASGAILAAGAKAHTADGGDRT